jgi:hypothetical protein
MEDMFWNAEQFRRTRCRTKLAADGICGYEFKVGESYLVYAHGSDRLNTDICTRTEKLVDAGKDLKVLGKAKALKSRKA